MDGVGWYTSGEARIPIFFPEDKVCCSNCIIFCRYEDAFRRYSCRATGEQLLRPWDGVGGRCPIIFEKLEE